jgi:iron complex outermembrane receptor protein
MADQSTVGTFLDVNRIEVLKGPQGTLYGRNATGGAVNVLPNTPELGENSGSIAADVGNYGKVQLTGIGNFAIGENSAFRIAASSSELDGYFDDETGEVEDTVVRAQFYSEPTDTFSYRIAADYTSQTGNGQSVDVLGVFGFVPPFAGGGAFDVENWAFTPYNGDEFEGLFDPAAQAFIQNGATIAPLFRPIDEFVFPERDDQFWGVNAEFNFDLGFGDLVVIPAYRYGELDNQFTGPPFKAAINQDESDQYSLEARLSGSTDTLDWIIGGFYFDETVEGTNSFNQFSTTSFSQFESAVESWAIFGQGTLSITESTRLVGGVRFTEEDRSMDAISNAAALVCLNAQGPVCPGSVDIGTIPIAPTVEESVALAIANGDLHAGSSFPGPPIFYGQDPEALVIMAVTPTAIQESKSESKVTFRAAVEHDLSEDSLLYVSYENGFRAGGFNLTVGQENYDGEEIAAFTIGSKNRFFDNRLEANFEAFVWEYEDQILAALGVDANGNNSFYSRNVGESTVQGFEIDFQFLVAPNTLLRGGVMFLDTEYDTFTYNQVDLSDDAEDGPNFLTPVTGCDIQQVVQSSSNIAGAEGVVVRDNPDEPLRSFDIDCSGNEALFSPENSLNFGLDQTFDLNNGAITASLDLRYRDERWVGFGFLDTQRADSVTTVDLTVNYLSDFGLGVTLYGNNLTDEYVLATSQVGSGNVAAGALEPPRTYGLRVKYDF